LQKATPLVAIQGFVQLLELSADKFGLAEKQLEYVERIRQAAVQMNRLVEDLRTARRLEEGLLPIKPGVVALGEFMDDVLCLQREAARPRGVSITIRPGIVMPPTAVFDADRVAQALGNLVQNAVRVSSEGQTVEVEAGTGDGWLWFRIRDRGPGIDPELLPRLFERFDRGRRKRTEGRGNGLGLFICREVASLHGGRVTADNRSGGGAEFRLEIPLVTVGPDEDGVESPADGSS
jgi:signal transduction histidine kinase